MATQSAPLRPAPLMLLSIALSLDEMVKKPADKFCWRCTDVLKVKKLHIQPQSLDFSRTVGRSGPTGLITVQSKGDTRPVPFPWAMPFVVHCTPPACGLTSLT